MLLASIDTTSIIDSLPTKAHDCMALQIRCRGLVLGVLILTNTSNWTFTLLRPTGKEVYEAAIIILDAHSINSEQGIYWRVPSLFQCR